MPLAPARGTCQWDRRAEPPDGRYRVLWINDKRYEVSPTPTGYVLYTVDDAHEVVRYDLDTNWADGWRCSCPDAVLRRKDGTGCKHGNALRAALKARPYSEENR